MLLHNLGKGGVLGCVSNAVLLLLLRSCEPFLSFFLHRSPPVIPLAQRRRKKRRRGLLLPSPKEGSVSVWIPRACLGGGEGSEGGPTKDCLLIKSTETQTSFVLQLKTKISDRKTACFEVYKETCVCWLGAREDLTFFSPCLGLSLSLRSSSAATTWAGGGWNMSDRSEEWRNNNSRKTISVHHPFPHTPDSYALPPFVIFACFTSSYACEEEVYLIDTLY